jgi:hypothetical protein
VGNGGIFGTKDDIKEIIKSLRKAFNVKYLGNLENFVGCQLIEDKKEQSMIIHQPQLLKHLEKEFGEHITGTKEYKTPAGPKTTITRLLKGGEIMNNSEATKYRSGVGMLLYLVKHSQPDNSNAVSELSKVCDGPNQSHWNALLRTIQYVLQTQDLGLHFKPLFDNKSFTLKGVSDSEYAGDKDTCISVYGFAIYLNHAPISWKSK